MTLRGRDAKAGRCPGSGKPALKGLADQNYQQCRVCNRNLMMTVGGYVPTHAAAKPSPPMSLKELLEEDTASEEIMEAYRALEARAEKAEARIETALVMMGEAETMADIPALREGTWWRDIRAALREKP